MKTQRGTFLLVVLAASCALGLASGSAFGSGSPAGMVHAPKPTHTPREKAPPGSIPADVGVVKMKQDKRTPSWIVRSTPNPSSATKPLAKSTVTPPRQRPHD